MRDSFKSALTLLICLLLHCSESKDGDNKKAKASRGHGKVFGKYPGGGLISFNTEQEKLDVSFDERSSISLRFKRITFIASVRPFLAIVTDRLGSDYSIHFDSSRA